MSPLHDAVEREKATTFMETRELLTQAVELDPTALSIVDVHTALREALDAIRSPAKWRRSDQDVERMVEQHRQMAAAEQQAQVAQQAGQAAQAVSEAVNAA